MSVDGVPTSMILYESCNFHSFLEFSAVSGIEKECRVIRDFYWKDPITKMFNEKVLVGPSKSHSHQRGTSEESMPPFINIRAPTNFFQNE